MAVSAVKTLTTRDGARSQQSGRTFTMRYLVETTDSHDGVQTVLTSPSVPQVGAYYVATNEVDLGARVTATRAQHVGGDPKLWHVDVTFESIQAEDPDNQDGEDPAEREPTVAYRFDKVQVPLQGNYDDVASGKVSTTQGIGNSLGQPFSPPPMIDETRPVMSVQRDEYALDIATILAYNDTVNATEFAGAAANTLKLTIASVNERFENGVRVWRKVWELAYNKRTWNRFILDHGTKLDEATGNFREILLDGAGAETDSTSPHYFEFTPFNSVEFRNLDAIRTLDDGPQEF